MLLFSCLLILSRLTSLFSIEVIVIHRRAIVKHLIVVPSPHDLVDHQALHLIHALQVTILLLVLLLSLPITSSDQLFLLSHCLITVRGLSSPVEVPILSLNDLFLLSLLFSPLH